MDQGGQDGAVALVLQRRGVGIEQNIPEYHTVRVKTV